MELDKNLWDEIQKGLFIHKSDKQPKTKEEAIAILKKHGVEIPGWMEEK